MMVTGERENQQNVFIWGFSVSGIEAADPTSLLEQFEETQGEQIT